MGKKLSRRNAETRTFGDRLDFDFHWVGAADPGGAVFATEGVPLIDQN